MKISQKFIAKEAGVSCSTVSRVLNNSNEVSQELKDIVIKTMERLKNVNPEIAKSGVTGKQFLVLVSEITYPLYAEYITGITNAFWEAGCFTTVCAYGDDLAMMRQAIIKANQEHLSGLIFITCPYNQEMMDFLEHNNILPTVFVNRSPYNNRYDSVTFDHYGTSRLATQYFCERGHKNIAHLTVDLSVPTTRDEALGFTSTLVENGICSRDEAESRIYVTDRSFAGGLAFARRFVEEKFTYTAVYTTSPEQAEGFCFGLLQNGLRIPEDVSLISLNRSSFLTNAVSKITAFEQPSSEMGAAAAGFLLKRLAVPENAAQNISYAARLCERESVIDKR